MSVLDHLHIPEKGDADSEDDPWFWIPELKRQSDRPIDHSLSLPNRGGKTQPK